MGMDRIRIIGGQRLNGTIPISGAKNATLPLMIASLLTDQTLMLDNVPRLADVGLLQRILGNHGVDIMVSGKRPGETQYDGQTLHISAANIVDTTAPYELVSRMRASFWVIGAAGRAHGRGEGVAAGRLRHRHAAGRPAHHGAGAARRRDRDRSAAMSSRAPRTGCKGGEINFPKVTVGGTHTALMAASLAHGTTVIENAAREPEIADVADCLNKMGAKITGAGTSRIVVEGVPQAPRRAPPRAARPHRDRHLCHGGGHDRRRRAAGKRARRSCCRSALDVLAQAGVEITADQ